jgi:hypothetical protein
VRNPIDSLMSTLNFYNMFSHSAKSDFNYNEVFPEWFDKAIKIVADMQASYFKVVFENIDSGKCLPYFVRFEDLLLNA